MRFVVGVVGAAARTVQLSEEAADVHRQLKCFSMGRDGVQIESAAVNVGRRIC